MLPALGLFDNETFPVILVAANEKMEAFDIGTNRSRGEYTLSAAETTIYKMTHQDKESTHCIGLSKQALSLFQIFAESSNYNSFFK